MGVSAKIVRRLAANLLKTGESRVWIDPQQMERVEGAITREDVRSLIRDGVIRKLPPSTPSRGRWRARREKLKRGRRGGPGRKRGPWISEKELWIARVRAQRRFLKLLKNRGLIDSRSYRRLRALVKGGFFRSVSHLKAYSMEHGILRAKGGESRGAAGGKGQ